MQSFDAGRQYRLMQTAMQNFTSRVLGRGEIFLGVFISSSLSSSMGNTFSYTSAGILIYWLQPFETRDFPDWLSWATVCKCWRGLFGL